MVPSHRLICLASAPTKIPFKEIVCGIESAVRELPFSAVEWVRGEVVCMLKAVEPPKSSLSRKEPSMLQTLRRDSHKSVVVLKADNGNASMLLDASDYHNILLTILEDSAFRKLKKDTTGRKRGQAHIY